MHYSFITTFWFFGSVFIFYFVLFTVSDHYILINCIFLSIRHSVLSEMMVILAKNTLLRPAAITRWSLMILPELEFDDPAGASSRFDKIAARDDASGAWEYGS